MQARRPNRLKYYDYSNDGWYYVTICVKDYKDHFGKVERDKMILNNVGKIADECWKKLKPYTKILNWIIILLCRIIFTA